MDGFLEEIGVDARASLTALGRRRRFPRGSLIFNQGDVAYEVLIVLAGAVKVSVVTAGGREVVLDVITAGALLGELSAVDGEPRSADAWAVGSVDVLALPVPRFQDLLEREARVSAALLRTLAGRVREASRRQIEFSSADALGRVCQRLLDISDRGGESAHAAMPFSQAELAAWAGLSREAVVKALRAMRTLGWIEMRGGRTVLLRDRGAVMARALA